MTRLAIAFTVLAIAVPNPALADCATTVRIWMYTARAQTTCLFRHYDEGQIIRAHQCGKTMTKEALQSAMDDGSRDFDETLRTLGKPEACESILNAFSNLVTR